MPANPQNCFITVRGSRIVVISDNKADAEAACADLREKYVITRSCPPVCMHNPTRWMFELVASRPMTRALYGREVDHAAS